MCTGFKAALSPNVTEVSTGCLFGESLPEDFGAKDLTKLKSKGLLKFASKSLFRLLKAVEKEIQEKIDVGQMFRPNSFIDILSSLVENELPQVGCSDHKEIFMTNVIMDFMCTRMKCIAKEKRLEITEEKRVKQRSDRKERKLKNISVTNLFLAAYI